MGINWGKQFEQLVQKQIEVLPNISIDRLYGVTTGYTNQLVSFSGWKDSIFMLLKIFAQFLLL